MLQSPLSTAVAETSAAFAAHSAIAVIVELSCEVRHCILAKDGSGASVSYVASHPTVLAKHGEFLRRRFPGYQPLTVEDTGLAAKLLAEGKLNGSVVIAMPHAAAVFGLYILAMNLPANDGYLTRFALVEKA